MWPRDPLARFLREGGRWPVLLTMQAFIEGRYGASIEEFKVALNAESSLTSADRSAILCNIACAELASELYRKSLKSCDAAIAASPSCPLPYLLKGRALAKLGRHQKARAAWEAGLAVESPALTTDVGIFAELAQEVSGDSTRKSTCNPAPALTPPETSPRPTAAAAEAAAAAPSVASSKAGSKFGSGAQPTAGRGRKPAAAPPANIGEVVRAAERAAEAAGMPDSVGSMAQFSPMILAAARRQLSHSSGIEEVDNAIARGYLLVNTSAYAAAGALFDVLLGALPHLVAAHMGKGSAYAMTAQYERAVACFSAAIEVDPLLFDAWKRRGQTQAARGDEFLHVALADLNEAVRLAATRDRSRGSGKGSLA